MHISEWFETIQYTKITIQVSSKTVFSKRPHEEEETEQKETNKSYHAWHSSKASYKLL